MNTKTVVASAVLLGWVMLFRGEMFADGGSSLSCQCPAEERVSITVMGEFEKVGVHRVPADYTLIMAIATAGGFSENANQRNVRIVRTGVDGKVERFMVNADALLNGESPDWKLQDRDLIVAVAKAL